MSLPGFETKKFLPGLADFGMKKWEGDCCKVEGFLSRDRIRLALTSEWWGGEPPSVTLKVIDTTCGSGTLHIPLLLNLSLLKETVLV